MFSLNIKELYKKSLLGRNVALSNLIIMTADGKASLNINKKNNHFVYVQLCIIDKSNIAADGLGQGDLHLRGISYLPDMQKTKVFKRF